MKISAIDYVTEDAAGNEIARTTGEIYTIESAEELEALFAAAVAEMEDAVALVIDPEFLPIGESLIDYDDRF